MATVRNQGKPVASARYDAFVVEQLDRARRRIRLLDVSWALLFLAAGTLAYALVVGVLDRKLQLPALARQIAFTGYAVASVAFLVLRVAWPLFRRVNPYYAARAVERAVPGAKNSVVNWLDLHDETLPPVIRSSLSQRAAKDLGQADLEQAISGRRVVWIAAGTAVLTFALFALFLASGSGGFRTLLARAFAPFGGGATARGTELTVVRPANGDAVLGVGQPFHVAVRVDGRVPDSDKPDALKLLYRYRDGKPYEEQPLEPDADNVWTTILPPSRTFNGFRYKVSGGDAETPEFRVTVRGTPLVTGSEVTYHYRPYTGWTDDHARDANLKALRGTEAELVVHTSRPVKEGRLEVETRGGKRNVAAEPIADDPQAMRARLVMDEDGQYRVAFTATDGDSNVAAMPYTIRVEPDRPPKVELTKPAADVTLPANGTLRLEGFASDDIGVKEVLLRLRRADGPALQPKPYRPDTSFRLADGGYPKTLDYKDFVALDQLKDEQGQPFPPAQGMVLEYWLEAADACDYPAPNRAESKHYKVNVVEPAPDKQQQQKEREQAAEEQKKHDQQQDEKLKKEEQQRQEEARAKEEQHKDEQQKKDGGKPEQAKGGEKKPDPSKNEGDKDLEKKAEAIKKELDRQEKQEQSECQKCEAKGPQDGKGKGKGDPQAGQPSPQDKGDAKPEGQKGEEKPGAGKEEGAKQDDKQPDTGGGKPEGAANQDAAAGDRKDKGNGEPQDAAAAKPDGPPQPDKSESKGGGNGEPSQSAAAPKPHGSGQNGDQGEAGAKAAGQEKGDKAVAKGDQPSVARGEPKPGEAGGQPKGDPKREGNPDAGGSGTKAQAKPAGEKKAEDTAVAKGEPKKGDGQTSEMARREQDVRQGTDKQSADAQKRLEDMARNAGDQQTRDLARKILDDAARDRESSPALPKGPPRDDARDGPPCQGKGDGNGQGTGSGKTAGSNGSQDSGESKSGNGRTTAQGNGKTGGQGREGGQWTPVATAQQGSLGSPPEPQPSATDPARRGRAGVLQVEDFRKIDKNILKDLKMTPEQWEAFKKAYTAKLRRDEAEQLPASQNDRIHSQGASEVKADKSDTGGAKKTGLGQVPLEFRGAYRDYTRRQPEK